ncbi:hypothetical protein [Vallitalea guaymasensis]|uniref:Uncharacterized protein n=1 Tax=Vallitalea guaymasensis TaxID=1185412 RepID=A0A8J8M6P4_9FIRM|nr:hypothetical protein [Vallitalea guaymasensis]QUH27387.1 hypothetical protein HYG85_18715 [Vallitalea guaymasensis]
MERLKDFFEKHWRIVVIFIAILYMGIGLFQLISGIELDPTKTKNAGTFLMFLALAVFVYGKRVEKMAIEKQKQEENQEVNQEVNQEENQQIKQEKDQDIN